MASQYTVKQLKEGLTQLGFKAPYGMLKADLVKYYEGAVYMVQNSIPKTNPNRDKVITYTPVVSDPKLSMMEHLSLYGWAIDKVPNYNPEDIRNMFLAWLHKVCDEFDPKDSDTWNRENVPYRDRGLLRRWIGHSDFVWKTRIACIPIFEKIWGTKDLLTSFDGGAFMKSLRYGKEYKTKHWMHCDQGRDITHFACVQGVVNLFENGPLDGGTILVSGAQHKFVEYINKHPVDGIGRLFPIDPFDPILKDCQIVKPCLKPGEILLFDSRVFHCNTNPKSNNPRMCIYVSMMPRQYCGQEDLNKRIKAFEEGRTTCHWAYGPEFSVVPLSSNPLYSKGLPVPKQVETTVLTEDMKKLIGY